jgi:hypothetical protein
MAANTAATRTGAEILDYNRAIKSLMNGDGVRFFVHVDGTWWDSNLNQNGYTPDSVAPANSASDGLFAESWAQGTLSSGLSTIIPTYFTPSQILMTQDVGDGDLNPNMPNPTGSVQGDLNYWFQTVNAHGIQQWLVWVYNDAGKGQIPQFGVIQPGATQLTQKGELLKGYVPLPELVPTTPLLLATLATALLVTRRRKQHYN